MDFPRGADGSTLAPRRLRRGEASPAHAAAGSRAPGAWSASASEVARPPLFVVATSGGTGAMNRTRWPAPSRPWRRSHPRRASGGYSAAPRWPARAVGCVRRPRASRHALAVGAGRQGRGGRTHANPSGGFTGHDREACGGWRAVPGNLLSAPVTDLLRAGPEEPRDAPRCPPRRTSAPIDRALAIVLECAPILEALVQARRRTPVRIAARRTVMADRGLA